MRLSLTFQECQEQGSAWLLTLWTQRLAQHFLTAKRSQFFLSTQRADVYCRRSGCLGVVYLSPCRCFGTSTKQMLLLSEFYQSARGGFPWWCSNARRGENDVPTDNEQWGNTNMNFWKRLAHSYCVQVLYCSWKELRWAVKAGAKMFVIGFDGKIYLQGHSPSPFLNEW